MSSRRRARDVLDGPEIRKYVTKKLLALLWLIENMYFHVTLSRHSATQVFLNKRNKKQ